MSRGLDGHHGSLTIAAWGAAVDPASPSWAFEEHTKSTGSCTDTNEPAALEPPYSGGATDPRRGSSRGRQRQREIHHPDPQNDHEWWQIGLLEHLWEISKGGRVAKGTIRSNPNTVLADVGPTGSGQNPAWGLLEGERHHPTNTAITVRPKNYHKCLREVLIGPDYHPHAGGAEDYGGLFKVAMPCSTDSNTGSQKRNRGALHIYPPQTENWVMCHQPTTVEETVILNGNICGCLSHSQDVERTTGEEGAWVVQKQHLKRRGRCQEGHQGGVGLRRVASWTRDWTNLFPTTLKAPQQT